MDENEFIIRTKAMKHKLYKLAYLYLGKEHLAIDIIDEAIYIGFKKRNQLRQPEYFETWLTRITINQCKKELKKQKRVLLWHSFPEISVQDYDALPLKEAVLRLPEHLKVVIVLRFFAGYSLKETAESLCIPQGTVVTRQRRALALLKLELQVDPET